VVAYSLYSSFNTTVRAAHFVFLPFLPPSAEDIAANNITLSDIQKVTEHRFIEFNAIGNGYLIEQSTKVRQDVSLRASKFETSSFSQPNDIGLALYDNPVGQLAWIAGKIKLCVYPIYISLGTIIECLPPQGLTHVREPHRPCWTTLPS
jgi:hypothetical protein